MAKRKIDRQRRAEIGREKRAKTRARILAAAVDCFGNEHGLLTSIEDIAAAAEVTRPTFYNHFSGMKELREALTLEVTHEYLTLVNDALRDITDARARTSIAIRLYLIRARNDSRWAWSMINLSANGVTFGAETYRQAELTVKQGMSEGWFKLSNSALGRDVILGTTLAAMGAILREDVGASYPDAIAERILLSLGLPLKEAQTCSRVQLPKLKKTAS